MIFGKQNSIIGEYLDHLFDLVILGFIVNYLYMMFGFGLNNSIKINLIMYFCSFEFFYNHWIASHTKKIIFTGGSGSIEFPEKKEGIYVKKYLSSIHVPDSAMIFESESKNTYENAVYTKKILDSLNLKGNFLLVTSGYHMPRAMAVFKKAGFTNLSPYITNRSSGLRRFTFDHLFIPNPGALIGLDMLIHEWIGYLTYKLKGYA